MSTGFRREPRSDQRLLFREFQNFAHLDLSLGPLEKQRPALPEHPEPFGEPRSEISPPVLPVKNPVLRTEPGLFPGVHQVRRIEEHQVKPAGPLFRKMPKVLQQVRGHDARPVQLIREIRRAHVTGEDARIRLVEVEAPGSATHIEYAFHAATPNTSAVGRLR